MKIIVEIYDASYILLFGNSTKYDLVAEYNVIFKRYNYTGTISQAHK